MFAKVLLSGVFCCLLLTSRVPVDDSERFLFPLFVLTVRTTPRSGIKTVKGKPKEITDKYLIVIEGCK